MKTVKRVFTFVVSGALFFLDAAGRLVSRCVGRRSAPTCVVLYYHAIPRSQRNRFARQMEILKRWAMPIPTQTTDRLEAGRRYAAITFDDAFVSVRDNALPELVRRRIPATIFAISEMAGMVPWWSAEYSDPGTLDRTMSADELRQLPAELVTIGSHTRTHPNLTKLPESDSVHEIADSKRMLEASLHRPVSLFSFPFGAFNERVIDVCRAAGYRRVFTSVPTLALTRDDEFVTPRVPVDPSDWEVEFVLKVAGAYRWMPYATAIKRSVTRSGTPRVQPSAASASNGVE